MYFFSSFSRVKVVFDTTEDAVLVRQKLEGTHFCGSRDEAALVRIYYSARHVEFREQSLDVPKREKAFLISPPASPPLGWEPIEEDGPHINEELVAALERMQPDDIVCELVPATNGMPRIVVETCEGPDLEGHYQQGSGSDPTVPPPGPQFGKFGPKDKPFSQTKRPPLPGTVPASS